MGTEFRISLGRLEASLATFAIWRYCTKDTLFLMGEQGSNQGYSGGILALLLAVEAGEGDDIVRKNNQRRRFRWGHVHMVINIDFFGFQTFCLGTGLIG